MRIKKVLSLLLVLSILLALCSCKKKEKPEDIFALLQEATSTDASNYVADITFTTTPKLAEGEKASSEESHSYRIYLDADTNRKDDVGQLYIKISDNGAEYQDFCDYTRTKNVVYFNSVNLSNFLIKDDDARKHIARRTTAYSQLDIMSTRPSATNEPIEPNASISPLILDMFNSFGPSLQKFALKNKNIFVDENDSLTVLSVNSADIASFIDYFVKETPKESSPLDSIRPFFEKHGHNNQVSNDFAPNSAYYAVTTDMLNSWPKYSLEEKINVITSNGEKDFALTLKFSKNNDILELIVNGSLTSSVDITTFSGTIKIKPIEVFSVSHPEEYTSHHITTVEILPLFDENNW